MRPDPDPNRQTALQMRLVAVVLAGTMILWIGAQWLGGVYGWQPRFAFLADLCALAGFTFALLVTYRIWRQRQKSPSRKN
jgi:membrane associated rhomboid family serine protease